MKNDNTNIAGTLIFLVVSVSLCLNFSIRNLQNKDEERKANEAISISVGNELRKIISDQKEGHSIETEPVEMEPDAMCLMTEEDEYYYYVTEEERETLARLVYQEGNNQSEECQRAIVSVVFNRVNNEHFNENTILDVIYAPAQFSVVPLLPNTTPTQTNYDAVDYVLKNGPTLPYYVCFFRSKYYFESYTPYCQINNTFFSYRKSHM